MASAATPPNLNLFAPELIESPYSFYANVRAGEPFVFAPPGQAAMAMLVLSRYSDVQAALRDTRLGRTGFRKAAEIAFGDGPLTASFTRWMLFRDPPEHTRLRALVNKAFTPRAAE